MGRRDSIWLHLCRRWFLLHQDTATPQPGRSYLGKGTGPRFRGCGPRTGRAQPATTFQVETPAGQLPVLEVAKGGKYFDEFLNDPERCEYFVPVHGCTNGAAGKGRARNCAFPATKTPSANRPPKMAVHGGSAKGEVPRLRQMTNVTTGKN